MGASIKTNLNPNTTRVFLGQNFSAGFNIMKFGGKENEPRDDRSDKLLRQKRVI